MNSERRVARWPRLLAALAGLVMLLAGAGRGLAQDAAATQPAEAASTTQPSPEVMALVTDLGAESFATRDAAQKKLLAMSDVIAPELREALKQPLSDEARQRITAVLRKFDDDRRFGPSVVTMHYSDAPLQNVLDDFSTQVGADLGLHRKNVTDYARYKRATIDLDHANFWQAVRQITKSSGLHLQQNGAEGMVLDTGGGMAFDVASEHMVVCGPFAIIPQSCTLNMISSVVYGRGPGPAAGIMPPNRTDSLTLQLLVAAEPKINVVSAGGGDWLKQCLDDRKHDLANLSQQNPMFFNNKQFWLLMATLRTEADLGTKITSLKGALKFTIAVKSQVVDIDDVLNAKNVTRTAGDSTLTLKQVVMKNQFYEAQLSTSGGMGNNNGMGWMVQQQMAGAIHLLDENGVALASTGSGFNGGRGHIDLTLDFMPANGAGKPKKLTWDVVTESRDLTVPFELTDLELPSMPR